MSKSRIIDTNTELLAAAIFQQRVSVWQEALLLDYGAPIEKFTSNSVKINGAYYLRSTCKFRVSNAEV